MRRPLLLLCAVVAGIFAVLLVYSQTVAFLWDEGFQLLAAQLIARGRWPYIDFCFPQAPLNAYWTAAWILIFGGSWRAAHALAAFLTSGTTLIAAHFVYTRVPIPSWRLPCSVATALLIGLDSAVIQYAPLGQPYALCLFLSVAAFWAAVVASERKGWLLAAAAGTLASGAAASSLLVALLPLVLLIWFLKTKPRAVPFFVAGASIPVLPLLWLFHRAPLAVLFNLFEYQMRYRRSNWEDAVAHDWIVLTSAMTSLQPLSLGVLFLAGLWFVARGSGWDRTVRQQFSLCGWMAAAVGAELCLAHPTFDWYFVLVIPFLAIPSAVGLYAIGSRVVGRARLSLVVVFLAIFSLAGAKTLFANRNGFRWRVLEEVATRVNQVTPAGSALWADEAVYFLTGRPPVEGTEFSYAEIIDLPAPQAARLHIVPLNDLAARAASGAYASVETCEEQRQIEDLNLPRLFRNSAAVGICHVFWDPVATTQEH